MLTPSKLTFLLSTSKYGRLLLVVETRSVVSACFSVPPMVAIQIDKTVSFLLFPSLQFSSLSLESQAVITNYYRSNGYLD